MDEQALLHALIRVQKAHAEQMASSEGATYFSFFVRFVERLPCRDSLLLPVRDISYQEFLAVMKRHADQMVGEDSKVYIGEFMEFVAGRAVWAQYRFPTWKRVTLPVHGEQGLLWERWPTKDVVRSVDSILVEEIERRHRIPPRLVEDTVDFVLASSVDLGVEPENPDEYPHFEDVLARAAALRLYPTTWEDAWYAAHEMSDLAPGTVVGDGLSVYQGEERPAIVVCDQDDEQGHRVVFTSRKLNQGSLIPDTCDPEYKFLWRRTALPTPT